MPLGTNNVTVSTAASFIPKLWSDEVIATYKKNLVMANLVNKMSQKGKKGDTIHIPKPTRGTASVKAPSTQVTLQAATETDLVISLNKHYEYSRLIEDIVEVQAMNSLRQFYTQDAGYALATQVDTDLIQLARGVNGGDGTAVYNKAYIGGDGTTLYTSGTPNNSALTDPAIRRTIQRLDDSDVPMDNRFLLVPPSTRNTLMGISRFTEHAFVGEAGGANTIRTGHLGNVYGVDVYVSSNCDTATGAARIALLGHKDALVLAEQQSVRSQTQYKQEWLADLFTSDMIYGVGELRDYNLVALAVV